MPIIRSQSILPYFTGLPEDVATNTLYWLTPDASEASCDEIVLRLGAFYNAIGDRLAPVISRTTAVQHRLYNLEEPMPRQPLFPGYQTTIPAAASATNAPLECAAVLSYHTGFTSGVPNARRRGRIYLGPLISTAFDGGSTTAFPLLAPTLIADIIAAVPSLWTDAGSTGIEWVQYSQTTGQHGTVVAGWVDNEVDTQRRRQARSTSRTTFTAPT